MSKINLNRTYEGLTTSRVFWPIIRSNFDAIQAGHNELEDKVTTIITTPIDGEGSAQELVLARKGEDSLGNKIDLIDAQLAKKAKDISDLQANKVNYVDLVETNTAITLRATIEYVDGEIASVADGTPEAFANLSAIEAAYPTGNSHVKLNTEDGYVYKWNGSAWVQGWSYQSTEWLGVVTEQDEAWEVE